MVSKLLPVPVVYLAKGISTYYGAEYDRNSDISSLEWCIAKRAPLLHLELSGAWRPIGLWRHPGLQEISLDLKVAARVCYWHVISVIKKMSLDKLILI